MGNNDPCSATVTLNGIDYQCEGREGHDCDHFIELMWDQFQRVYV